MAVQASELELKFAATPRCLAKIATSFSASAEPKPLRSVYFDTDHFDLWHSGFVLRIRETSPGTYAQGVKAKALKANSPFLRHEVEVPVANETPDLTQFPPVLAREIHEAAQSRDLSPRFATAVMRQTFDVKHADSVIEVSLDKGKIKHDGKELAICEVELEMKDGAATGLFSFAEALAAKHGLTLMLESKSERGFRLLSCEAAKAVRASWNPLKRDISLRAAIGQILVSTLHQFLGNWAALKRTDSADAIHQLRVSLRRMRSAFSIFKPVLADTAAAGLSREARAIAKSMTRARKADVMLAAIDKLPALAGPESATMAAFHSAIVGVRRKGHAQALAVLRDPATTGFVIQLDLLMAKLAEGIPSTAALDEPADDFAVAPLVRLVRRARKSGKDITSLSPSDMHALRITLKKLSYGIEFFDGILEHPKHWHRIAKHVECLRNELGIWNDFAESAQFIAQELAGASARHETVVGLLHDEMSRGLHCEKKKIAGIWKDFRTETKR